MSRRLAPLALTFAAALAAPPLAGGAPHFTVAAEDEPDLITLADGKEIECRVLFENDETVVYRSRRKTREIARDEVAEIASIERSLRQYLDQLAEMDRTDVDRLTELALFAETSELPAEARNTWIRILTLDPENERAWTKLGGTHGRKGWRLKVRGRFYTIDQLRERASDWKNAMQLPTAHFLIETDVEPERALDLALDVERLYLAYYEVLGPELRLFPFDEVPEIHIYADQEDYPSPPTPGWDAWYARNDNILYVDASEEPDLAEIRHNFVYVLLFNSFRRSLDTRTGALPAWAREGLATSFSLAMRPDPGAVKIEPGVPLEAWFAKHALDEEPLTIKRLVSSDGPAFKAGTNAERFAAQAYTLTFFLINAENGKYRQGFADYLRSAFVGKGAATHLEKALGVDLEDLEESWSAFVKSTAGR